MEGLSNVRFGSKADICGATSHVRFTPNSDRESGPPQKVMSALPPKADMRGATSDVRFGAIADIRVLEFGQAEGPFTATDVAFARATKP